MCWNSTRPAPKSQARSVPQVKVHGLSVGDIGRSYCATAKCCHGMASWWSSLPSTGKPVSWSDDRISSRAVLLTPKDTRKCWIKAAIWWCRYWTKPRPPGGMEFCNAKVRDTLYRYYYEQTKRRPMILPFMVKDKREEGSQMVKKTRAPGRKG